MQKIGYILFRFLIFKLKITPFWLIYIFSDILAFILYHLIGYRKKIVFENLKNSFPEKSEKQIIEIAKKFYKHLIDITLESLKGFTYPIEKLIKRCYIIDDKIYKNYFNNNQSIIAALGHYGNWEWSNIVTSKFLKHLTVVLYKPLSNKYIDAYIKKSRSINKSNLVPITLTKKAFVNDLNNPFCVYMVADQNPFKRNSALWINFLNQKTACLAGVENYAKIFNLPVIFVNIKKVKRGCYETVTSVICENPKESPKGEITKLYMKKLEETIIEAPEFYLWSHRRWKIKWNNEEIIE